jgi:rhodanese-related sulfurtransferase
MIDDLVPRRGTRTVVVDGGACDGGLAVRAASRLQELGYGDAAVLEGGVEAWSRAGYELFSGVNVPSKAFGEIVEKACGTPQVTPEVLHARLSAGDHVAILDARPMEEYRRMNIPGGIDVPGAEAESPCSTWASALYTGTGTFPARGGACARALTRRCRPCRLPPGSYSPRPTASSRTSPRATQ